MAKISNFRKAMRLDKKAARHQFRNFLTPAITDTHAGYLQDKHFENIKKTMGKSAHGPLMRPCR